MTDGEPAPATDGPPPGCRPSGSRSTWTAGRVRVDGELVTDLDTLAPVGTRVVVRAE